MKERPIIFSAPMVQALLAGKKTQTRRVIKPQPDKVHDNEPYWYIGGYRAYQYRDIDDIHRMGTHNPIKCPYGKIGDRLWVREMFCLIYPQSPDYSSGEPIEIDYKATPTERMMDSLGLRKWTSSLFMKRKYSRITLEITDIRVERLCDITENDAKAEGVDSIDDYILLFESINDKGSWQQNHYVWVIKFKRIDNL